jgi:hypothetical protein
VVITAVNFDAEATFQLFDVVIKWAAKAQQAGVVCGFKGDFASVYVQTVPLMHVSPDAEHLPASKEIIHAMGERRKHCDKYGDEGVITRPVGTASQKCRPDKCSGIGPFYVFQQD